MLTRQNELTDRFNSDIFETYVCLHSLPPVRTHTVAYLGQNVSSKLGQLPNTIHPSSVTPLRVVSETTLTSPGLFRTERISVR